MFKSDLLKGKRILVTGGGSGLGRAMADRFAELGADLYLCGRRRRLLDQAAREIEQSHGTRARPLTCDIRDSDSVETMVATIWQDGPLHGLVNNAAGNFISRTQDLSARGFAAITSIVLNGTFHVTNACGRRWIAGGAAASVVNIVTTWVWTGSAYVVPSAMAKSGVATMTKSLAVEWAPHGIRLNAIAPGPFPTEGAWQRLLPGDKQARDYQDSVPLGRPGEHGELANLAVFLLADGCDYLTGAIIPIDGGQHLNSANTFARLRSLTDQDWIEIRASIKQANDRDRAERG